MAFLPQAVAAEGTIIINAFVQALRERPTDFVFEEYPGSTEGFYRLCDLRTGQKWWIANEDYGFRMSEPRLEFGYWARRKGWRAFKAWSRDIGQGEGARAIFLALDDANVAARRQ